MEQQQIQPPQFTGGDEAAGGEIDFQILANYLMEEEQNGYGLALPPAGSVFNPVSSIQQGLQGMDGGGGSIDGLLGFNFAAHLNSRMGWGLPSLGGAPMQEPTQQQAHPLPSAGPFLGIGMIREIGMPHQPTPLQPFVSPPGAGGIGGVGGGIFAPGPAGLIPGAVQLIPASATVTAASATAAAAAAAAVASVPVPVGVMGGAGGMVAPSGESVGEAAAAGMVVPKATAVANGKRRRRQERRDAETRFQGQMEQVVRRRERNRVLARQTRMRKKFFYESLQQHMATLRSENRRLKTFLKDRLGERAEEVVYACTSELSRQVTAGGNGRIGDTDEDDGMAAVTDMHTGDDVCPDADAEVDGNGELVAGSSGGEGAGEGGGGGDVTTRNLSTPEYRLMRSLQTQNFVVTEPSLPDNPIVFASDGFLKLTGYSSKEVIGRNCRFLQGPDTDKKAVAAVREAIEKGEDASVCFLNYKADGTPFWNQLFVAALRNEHNRIVNYVGAQCLVSTVPPTQSLAVRATEPNRRSSRNSCSGSGDGSKAGERRPVGRRNGGGAPPLYAAH